MGSRLAISATVAFATACGPKVQQIREHAARGDRLFVQAPAQAALEPGGSSASAYTGNLAVDLVALGVMASASALAQYSESNQIERIVAACPVRDPAVRVGELVWFGLVRNFGFPQAEALAPASAPEAGQVVLEIHTDRFAWSGHFSWRGAAVLRGPHEEVLWKSNQCDAHAEGRSADLYRDHCECAQGDLDALAAMCSKRLLAELGVSLIESRAALPDICRSANVAPCFNTTTHGQTDVYAGPDPNSNSLMTTLKQGTPVCASPQVTLLGTRRVQLSDGSLGFVRDSNLPDL